MFPPCTAEDMKKRGWDAPDIILVSGDAYIDAPGSGTAVIARVLESRGFKVGIIPQPDVNSHEDIRKLGEPKLFWAVSSGCVDSMVANYTATGKKRRSDDFTPGGKNNARPDRAVIAYCNLLRSAFKPCRPIVIGGIEASLRRIAHYDFWSDKVRRPILFDAKADILSYGMAERSVTALAEAFRDGREWRNIRGICYAKAGKDGVPEESIALPDFKSVSEKSKEGHLAFLKMFRIFSENQEALTSRTLTQLIDTRNLIHNPPARLLSREELDEVYALPYELEVHPECEKTGKVKAIETIRFSITTHRGCYGACNFCAIAAHQGRQVVSRSEASITDEAGRMTEHPRFRGIIQDVGGATANMYGFECRCKIEHGACRDRRCLYPEICNGLHPDHRPLLELLKKLRQLPKVRRVFTASGIRPDLVSADRKHGREYIQQITRYHVSGQLKLAPEHISWHVLSLMGKPGTDPLLEFKKVFEETNRKFGLKQFLTYYFIAAHPGCTMSDMKDLKRFATRKLKLNPEQVQVFTPTPSTWSTAMYYTGLNPETGEKIYVAKGAGEKQRQKEILQG
ncbi:MAG: YgiQ family radical SAM protein [Kiritimatiellia bacterium]